MRIDVTLYFPGLSFHLGLTAEILCWSWSLFAPGLNSGDTYRVRSAQIGNRTGVSFPFLLKRRIFIVQTAAIFFELFKTFQQEMNTAQKKESSM
jgi:hypothetical protein